MIISWIGGKLGGGGRVSMGAQFDGYRVTIGATVHNTNNMTLTVPYQSGLIKVQQMNNKLTGRNRSGDYSMRLSFVTENTVDVASDVNQSLLEADGLIVSRVTGIETAPPAVLIDGLRVAIAAARLVRSQVNRASLAFI